MLDRLPFRALLALTLAACAPRAAAPPAGRADLAGAIADADRSLAAAIAARDEAAFRRHLDPEAAFGGGAGRYAEGPDAVVAAWARFLDPAGPLLAWEPDVAWVSASGDLGYSRGAATLTGPDGALRWSGRYVTLWRRGADGRFRVLADLGDEDPAPLAALARETTRSYASRAGDLEARTGRLTGDGGRHAGVWMTVRVREAGGWRTAIDTAIPAPAEKR
jgi:ketosteroid isomerase-like protein